LVDGNIGEIATAARIVETAMTRFRSIDALINNAGIFFAKPFTDYTAENFRSLASTNLEGFIYITQLAIKQMVAQKTGGSIVSITTTLVEHPIASVTASVPMITKGGIQAITRSLAIEYAKDGIRVNAVAPGVVDTPMHKNDPKNLLKSLSPLAGRGKRTFRSLLPLSYLSHGERRLRKEASFYAGRSSEITAIPRKANFSAPC
jgi:NAD(P)-dependent dehydrogenase (short-subunit alcohol dehydrogenase family)